MTSFPAALLINGHDVNSFAGVRWLDDPRAQLLSPGAPSGVLPTLGSGADGVSPEDLPFAAYTMQLEFLIEGATPGQTMARLFAFVTTIRPENSVVTLERLLVNATDDGYDSWTSTGVIAGYPTRWVEGSGTQAWLDLSVTITPGRWSNDGGTTWSVL